MTCMTDTHTHTHTLIDREKLMKCKAGLCFSLRTGTSEVQVRRSETYTRSTPSITGAKVMLTVNVDVSDGLVNGL